MDTLGYIHSFIQFITPGGDFQKGNYKPMLWIESEAKLLLIKPISH